MAKFKAGDTVKIVRKDGLALVEALVDTKLENKVTKIIRVEDEGVRLEYMYLWVPFEMVEHYKEEAKKEDDVEKSINDMLEKMDKILEKLEMLEKELI